MAKAAAKRPTTTYRCDECGHVWTISMDGKAIMEHVTPLDEARMGGVTPRPADSDR